MTKKAMKLTAKRISVQRVDAEGDVGVVGAGVALTEKNEIRLQWKKRKSRERHAGQLRDEKNTTMTLRTTTI